MVKDDVSLIIIKTKQNRMPYNWSLGERGVIFFKVLKDEKKILGIKCPKCNKVYIPPRRVCGACFEEMNEWVELGNTGTIEAFSVVNYEFIDPDTGEFRAVPYTYGYIKLDGADTTLTHNIDEVEVDKLKIGSRVEAVFADKRVGRITDIIHFRLV